MGQYTAEQLATAIRDNFHEDWSPLFMRSQISWILRHVFKKGDWLADNILDRAHNATGSPARTWYFSDPAYPIDVWLVQYNPTAGRYRLRRII